MRARRWVAGVIWSALAGAQSFKDQAAKEKVFVAPMFFLGDRF